MTSYAIFFRQFPEDAPTDETKPKEGWYGLIDAEGRLLLFNEPDEAAKFDSEEAADVALDWLEENFGVDREDANVLQIANDQSFELKLGGEKYADGIAVENDGASRLLIVRNSGMEASADIPNEVADRLIAVLGKVQKLLRPAPPK